jgi:hypothetical protein
MWATWLRQTLERKKQKGVGVTILHPFFTFFTHVTARAPSFPTPPTHMHQHVPPNHGTYSRLHCTHMHYPICPCPCLVPYGCAAASYYIPLTHSSMTHSSPFSTIHLPHLACFLIPIYVTGTSCFTFIRGPMLLSLIQYYT